MAAALRFDAIVNEMWCVAFLVSQLRVRVSTTAFKAERYLFSKDFIINQVTTETIVDVFIDS